MKIICQITNIMITYFILIWKKNENLSFIQDLIIWMFFHYSFDIKIIRSDHEIKRNWTRQYLINVDIIFEPCFANTQIQSDITEWFEWMMMMKTKIMWLFINLSHSMWKKIVGAVIYFYNWTSKTTLEWKNFYETFHTYVWRKKTVSDLKKFQVHHFQLYECKCYVLIKFQNDFHKTIEFWKLNSRLLKQSFWQSHKQLKKSFICFI